MGRYAEGPPSDIDERYDEGLSPHIENARSHHRSMARDVVAGGLRPGQLATLYGMSKGQISRIMGSPAFQAELKRLEDGADVAAMDVRDEISKMVPKAIENLNDDLDMDVENHLERQVRQKASLEVLTIAGIKPSAGGGIKIDIGDKNTQINISDLSDDDLRKEVFDLASGE
jgi:hypothetical protein